MNLFVGEILLLILSVFRSVIEGTYMVGDCLILFYLEIDELSLFAEIWLLMLLPILFDG